MVINTSITNEMKTSVITSVSLEKEETLTECLGAHQTPKALKTTVLGRSLWTPIPAPGHSVHLCSIEPCPGRSWLLGLWFLTGWLLLASLYTFDLVSYILFEIVKCMTEIYFLFFLSFLSHSVSLCVHACARMCAYTDACRGQRTVFGSRVFRFGGGHLYPLSPALAILMYTVWWYLDVCTVLHNHYC